MSHEYPAAGRSATSFRALARAGALAGTLAAIIEMVPVLSIQWGMLSVSPARIFQAIASGVLGSAAYRGGTATIAAGIALHWLISIGAALIFGWAASRWRDLKTHAVFAGLGFGVLAFAVMSAIVVPFSASAIPPDRDRTLMLISIAVHVLFFGLPIALAVRSSLARSQEI